MIEAITPHIDISTIDFSTIIDADGDVDGLANMIPKLKYDGNNLFRVNVNNTSYITFTHNMPSRPLLKRYHSFDETPFTEYVTERNLIILINDIIATVDKYVFPMVFVSFARNELHIATKISFNSDELAKLRVWSNQLRSIMEKSGTKYVHISQFANDVVYYGWRIARDIIEYCSCRTR